MSKKVKLDLMQFYKDLLLKVKIEETRLDIYKNEFKSIESSIDPKRAMYVKLKMQYQLNFVETLHLTQKKLVIALDHYAKTLNDIEAYVFVNLIVQGKSLKEVCTSASVPVERILDIEKKLKKELDERIVVGEI